MIHRLLELPWDLCLLTAGLGAGFSFLQPCKPCMSASSLETGTYQESSSGKCHCRLLPHFAEENEKGECREGSD